MHSTARWGLFAAATLLAGCQINPYGENQRFTTWSDADIQPRTVRFPILLSFPDETMYFYPIYDNVPRADLNLRAISCARQDDGTLVVTARVQNMGADIITNTPLLTGEVAAFRAGNSQFGSGQQVTRRKPGARSSSSGRVEQRAC